MEWAVIILEMLAVVSASAGMIFILLITYAVVKRIIKQPRKMEEKTKMSKEASEGTTFNDVFMFMIAVPLVLLWVGFAGFVIHSGLGDAAVLENIEAYTTLIAILGGPALLIIKDALDVWKQEQAEKTAFYKIKAQAVIDYNDHAQKQAQMIEAKEQEHGHKIETKK
jgi:hydrogenase-4 membrane subunit HyfE